MFSFYDVIAVIWLLPSCLSRKTASCFAIRVLRKQKVMWPLSTPATFKKVDQTFLFGNKVCNNSNKVLPTSANNTFRNYPTYKTQLLN